MQNASRGRLTNRWNAAEGNSVYNYWFWFRFPGPACFVRMRHYENGFACGRGGLLGPEPVPGGREPPEHPVHHERRPRGARDWRLRQPGQSDAQFGSPGPGRGAFRELFLRELHL
ncbi:hypothetical protein SBV1_1600019 [Verrucomicrobia bacterium]|nr:hypothetical protein SBV1_1600019 [Verrucomicrobiota bacterium]